MGISLLFSLAALASGAATLDAHAPSAPLPIATAPDSASIGWGACPPIFPQGCEIAVLQGDPAKPNADVFLRIPAGYAIPAHRHSSAERMILVNGRLKVRYKGTAAATLAAGHYAYGPAGLPHEATCEGSEPCLLFIAFEGPVDAEPHEGAID